MGYFISEHIALQGGLTFSKSKAENNQSLTSDQTSLGGVLGGTYFFTPEKQFSFTTGLRFSYERTVFHRTSLNNEIKSNSFGVMLSPGMNYFLSKKFALNANLGFLSYNSHSNNLPNSDDSNVFNLALNFSNINFGLTYKI